MRKGLFISFLFFVSVSVIGQKISVEQLLVPEPVSVTEGTGNFLVNNKTSIHVVSSDASAKRVAAFLSKKLSKVTGYTIPVISNSKNENSNGIKLSLVSDPSLGNEGYKLNVKANEISITANKPAGLFYGMQTLFQLMPKEIEENKVVKNVKWEVPVCSVKDYPRFAWRGLMFDVSRHFFTKDFIKKYIDEMAKYKFNVFHWHLTDDQGWRIEIKGLPQLTSIGAWRVPRTGQWEIGRAHV